jgi:hypothetical protein
MKNPAQKNFVLILTKRNAAEALIAEFGERIAGAE